MQRQCMTKFIVMWCIVSELEFGARPSEQLGLGKSVYSELDLGAQPREYVRTG